MFRLFFVACFRLRLLLSMTLAFSLICCVQQRRIFVMYFIVESKKQGCSIAFISLIHVIFNALFTALEFLDKKVQNFKDEIAKVMKLGKGRSRTEAS